MAEHSFRRLAAALSGLLLVAGGAAAQQPLPPPTASSPEAPPQTIRPEPLPPLAPAPPSASAEPNTPTPPASAEPDSGPVPAGPSETREFCGQSVSYALADRDSIPERYRAFVGIWSDASWTPQICAALIVQNVRPDGTASILYVFGPMSSNARAAGGILRGTGIVRDGELRFQNSDGSQFAFRPLYADLDGRLTTPGGQTYQAVFKKTL
jgi:hypothetical protein